jgi:hypothetical protein
MTDDYDNPEIETRWCADQRTVIARYLDGEGVRHGRIGEWPAWHVAPYVSVWAIESAATPDALGWWAIAGDLPTDYVSASQVDHPRKALQMIARRWLAACEAIASGRPADGFLVGDQASAKELAPLLRSRAAILLDWADDESLWEDEDAPPEDR